MSYRPVRPIVIKQSNTPMWIIVVFFIVLPILIVLCCCGFFALPIVGEQIKDSIAP